MDLIKAAMGVAVTVFMMVAPQLGIPYLQNVPVLGKHEEQTLAKVTVDVGPRVALMTLDAGGNRTAVRVLWVEVDGAKLDKAGQGQGRLDKVRLAAATLSGLSLGNDTLQLKPGDEVTVEGFEGKWAYRPDGMVGVLRMEGSVVAARLGDKGLGALGTREDTVAPSWASGGLSSLASNVTVRAGRTAFVSTESGTGDDVQRHLTVRDVRVNAAKVEGTKWGEGPLDSVSFVIAGPGSLRNDEGPRDLQQGERVEVLNFIGAYVVFRTKPDQARVALEGYASSVTITPPEVAVPLATGSGLAPVPGFDFAPAQPRSGLSVKFTDRSSDSDGLVMRREWRFGDGDTSAEANPSHAFDRPGVYTVTLVVTDNTLLQSLLSRNLTVLPTAPLVGWQANPGNPSKLDKVQFVDASRDPDGRIVQWEWAFGDGTFSKDQHPSHQFPDNGLYNVTLAVWDNDGQRSAETRPFQVRNLAPLTRFSWLPAQPLSGEAIQFRDTSVDHDGNVIAWLWDFGDGGTSRVKDPLHAFLTKGPHSVLLTTTDDDGSSSTQQSNVDVRNSPPNADFRWEPTVPAEGAAAHFTDLSTDPDGRIVERVWSFGDGSVSTAANPDHTYLLGGNLTVTLTAKDDDGARTTAMRTLHVNRRPVAAFTTSPAAPATQEPVQFADNSVDPDGSVASWAWDFGDGNTSSIRSPQHQYGHAGLYQVTLTATDDQGARGVLTRPLNVTNAGPLADFDWDPALPTSSAPVQFRDRSTDRDGVIRGWSWTFGDGGSALGQNPAHRYQQAGSFPVTLVVTDDSGTASTKTQTVRVNAAPIAAFAFNPPTPSTTTDVSFADTSADPDGSIASWAWDFGDGTASDQRNPVHRFGQQGLFVVRLTVTDNDGARATASRNVPVGSLPPRADFTVATPLPVAGSPVRFVDTSVDVDGSVQRWLWEFGDGGTSSVQNPEHAYATTGAKRVKLTVTDDSGKTASVEKQLRVASASPVNVVFRVVYPDGQPVDLTRGGFSVAVLEQATGARIEKGGPRPLQVGPDGVARGTFEAGEWAPEDPVHVILRLTSAQVDQTTASTMPEDGDLGDIPLRINLVGRIALQGPSGTRAPPYRFTDPTERVLGKVFVTWRDGVPVRGASVITKYTWEQLGVYYQQVQAGPPSIGATADDGTFAFAVPYTLGAADGPGAYLPGQYRIHARAELLARDGLAWWEVPLTFQEDPSGLRGGV